jgi:hypothetical protein
MPRLYEVFSNPAIESFGKALKYAVRKKEFRGNEDYASLIELEYVETPEQFVESLKKFLRRYDAYARKYEQKYGYSRFRPSDKDLTELIRLAEEDGVKIVCSALIAHALVKTQKKGAEPENDE